MDKQKRLKEAVQELCKAGEKYKRAYSRFLKEESLDERRLLKTLTDFLLEPDNTLILASYVPHLLLELLFLASQRQQHVALSVALGKLVRLYPDVLGFSLQYFEKNPNPFWDERNDEPVEPKRRRGGDSIISDLEIVQACCSLLEAKCDYFRLKWDWSLFMETYLNHAQEKVRWLAGHCLALVTGMTDSQQRHFELQLVEPDSALHYRIEHEKPLNNTVRSQSLVAEEDTVTKTTSRHVISVCGINLPVWKVECQQEDGNFIMVDSSIANLRRLALAVATGRGIYLHGPVGSGKTFLVEHLAKLTGRIKAPDFVKVQLGDEMDSKMLLGTYRCTDVPGEFIWQPGILTQAVMGGYWILLEDVDSAAADVAVVLASLVETGTLSVPGYRDSIKAKPGFQLFVTQRLVASRHSKHQNILHKQWLHIFVQPFSKEELVLVIEKMYPVLQTVATRMVEVFLLFSAGQHTNEETTQKVDLPTKRRLTSTRDLMKWCARAVEGFNVASQDSALKILQDAIDIFCLSVADSNSRLNLAVAVASCLGIVKTKAEYFCKDHKPVISLTTTHLSAGRTTLLRQSKMPSRRLSMAERNFSLTRPAACLLESIACCVRKHEPVLLVGETGTGKTTVVQHLAAMTGHQLIVINMNQQSDSADLLGGYKPVDFKHVVRPVREEFEQLFRKYFASQPNHTFLNNCMIFFNTGRWASLIHAMRHVQSTALKQFMATSSEQNPKTNAMRKSWQNLGVKLHKLEAQLRTKSALAFAFIEGTLIKALQKGYWVLLDEINLASAETLECLSGLLEGSAGSLCLLERGDQEPVVRHPDFHVFACMNPATDVGKKDLPAGLRNRFTEFFVDELNDKRDLIMLLNTYLQPLSPPSSRIIGIVEFYLKVRKEASRKLTDGVGYRPHYSLRTLCRALIVGAQNKCGSVPRSLYEGLCLSFLSQLDHTSHPAVQQAISEKLFVGEEEKGVLKAPLPQPASSHGDEYINFEGYWVKRGKLEPHLNDKYILTSSVQRNLHDLVRVVSLSDHPVLLQGETSVGKTSLITYLAAASGNVCVRINNHEHTDLQEYIGSYCANQTGQLVFKEGVLVEAMREGSWIILDELNLAPSDVLEALNRVLDDNRELFIPETQQTIKAHPQFRLFATQNPPGLYGGRKVLSRAFQNRFVELHFGEIPPNELVTILNRRCEMPVSYCRRLVEVMRKLQVRRRGSAAFAGKHGFMTLRDLFRWGERYRQAKPRVGQRFYDWDQYVADEGFLVLAGRVRRAEETEIIQYAIETQFRRKIDPQKLFTFNEMSPTTPTILKNLLDHRLPGFKHVVWTFNMRRLAVLVGKAIELNEPVLLVGETGCGKTTVCQMLAAASNQTLYTVNCHLHTESADFLGGLRPVRDHITDQKEEGAQKRLFEWVDGPLIKAMNAGDLFLADEISLADDSVLERLNSLLEPERTLLLAEKGGDTAQVIVAKEKFQFVGTMNPGGDYGKKELSPALRNRFTEIWCEPVSQREDLFAIIEHNLKPGLSLGNQEDGSTGIGNRLLDFLEWFRGTEVGKRLTLSVRDIMTWVNFINTTAVVEGDNTEGCLDLPAAYVNGACLTFLDSLGSGVTSSERPSTLKGLREVSLRLLRKQVEMEGIREADLIGKAELTDTHFGIRPFYIPRGTAPVKQDSFTFSAPTTLQNTVRVLRALQLSKPILLEGSPGTGKTSLVAAIAKIAGHQLVRINLSDQTDVSDLFGADLPVEGGQGGQFAWRDGPFLRALKAGHWILLDELNLASQSVLEGLNACLDHRGEVFLPELGRSFYIQSSSTKLFGTQNPLRQGGARRGLPQSFLNRFTQIFIDALTSSDLCLILSETFPSFPQSMISDMVKFNMRLARECGEQGLFGHSGSPWEMNLRDLTRWCQAIQCSEHCNPAHCVGFVYIERMRTAQDRMKVKEIYEEEMGQKYPLHLELPRFHVTPNMLYVGDVSLNRTGGSTSSSKLAVLRQQFPVLRSLMRCVRMNWLTILVGPSGSGKTSVVQLLADLTGRELRVLCVNSAMDTCDILGGFEQVDCSRELDEIGNRIQHHILAAVRNSLLSKDTSQASQLLQHLGKYWKAIYSKEQNWEQRLQVLQQLSAKLPFVEEQQYIEQRLNVLKNETGPTSTSGGKFRWVDSILVKALIDGCWLLVDNVNLCSPAVLDRLNAVLEPGGQLTIGERGVDADGNLVTITPHPDFRLFLAMDPINGEISRAMRNRGVEIFLNEDLSQNVLDARALLAQQGLDQVSLQDALLCVHRDITQGRQNVEKISELLKAAFLLCQNTLHGREALKSLQSACSEVYQSENVSIKSTRSSLSSAPAPMSLSAHSVRSDSTLAMVYLQGAALLNKNLLSEILPGLQIHYNITSHLVISLYECASFNDLTLRHHWLDTLVAKDKSIKNLSNTLYETTASMLPQLPQNATETEMSNLPWDLRHLPELVPHNYECNAQERLLTLLHFRATKVLLARDRVEQKSLTVDRYSNAAKEGQVREDITTHAAIICFRAYLDQFDVVLETLLKSSRVIPTQNCFYLLLWRFRLSAMGELPLMQEGKRTGVIVQEAISRLSVHYQWLFKWTIPVLNRMLNQDSDLKSSNVVKQFETTTGTIKMSLPDILSPLQKIGKLVRRFMGQPSPRSSVEHAELLLKLARISDILDVWQEDKPSWKSCVGFLSTQKGVQAWESIVSACSSLLPDGNVSFTEVDSSLTEMEKDLEMLDSGYSIEDFTTMQLWPLREFVVLLLSVALRRELFEDKQTSVIKENLKVQLCGLSSIPATLAAMLSAQDGKISMELLYNMLQHQKMSPATKHPKIWVTLDSETDEDQVEGTCSTETEEPMLTPNPLHCPALTVLATQLLLPTKNQLRHVVTLGSVKTRICQLSILKQFLWKNMSSLTSDLLNYRQNETSSAVSCGRKLLGALNRATLNEETELDINVLVKVLKDGNKQSKEFCEILLELHDAMSSIDESITVEENGKWLIQVGQIWALLGYLQVIMYTTLYPIDPVEKKALKLRYIQEEITQLKTELQIQELQTSVLLGVSLKDLNESNVHPRIKSLRLRLNHLQNKEKELKKYVAVRPIPSQYGKLSADILYYTQSLASREKALNLCNQLIMVAKQLCDPGIKIKTYGTATQLLLEAQSWQESQEGFCAKLHSEHLVWYPDITLPILTAATTLSHGIKLLVDGVEKLMLPYAGSINGTLTSLIHFPSRSSEQLLHDCTKLLNQVFVGESEKSRILEYQLLKAHLRDQRNIAIVQNEFEERPLEIFFTLMKKITNIWEQEENKRKELKAEKETIYDIRCASQSEEEQTEAEIEQLFPSLESNDFYDFEESNEELEKTSKHSSSTNNIIELINQEDAEFVARLHSQIMTGFTYCNWLLPKITPEARIDFVRPLLERFQVFTALLEKISKGADSSVDLKLQPSIMVIASAELSFAESGEEVSFVGTDIMKSPSRSSVQESRPQNLDFYHDSNIKEAKSCLPVLNALTSRVQELLQEWPQHPTLMKIWIIVKRILAFPLTSPLARFQTGLELLLAHIYEWEENAHSGVSISTHLSAVSSLIATWRKLQLQSWKDCLCGVRDKVEQGAAKWWLYLHSLVDNFVNVKPEEKAINSEDVLTTLKQFMEQSSLGEFNSRLTLLLSFHCHVQHMQFSTKQSELMVLLWNLHKYYEQFSQTVNAMIDEQKAPIEKKLKECVKIFRWEDKSYWAVRETIKKIHKTLHKHIREYQAVLKQPVALAISNFGAEMIDTSTGIRDRPQRNLKQQYKSLMTAKSFLCSRKQKPKFHAKEVGSTVGLLPKSEYYFLRALDLSQRSIEGCPYGHLSQSADILVGTIIETYKEQSRLSASDCDSTSEYSKMVKECVRQRRSSLNLLFGTLCKLGLSYRTGIVKWHCGDDLTSGKELFMLPPIDLVASFYNVTGYKGRRIGRGLLNVWQDCDIYFQRCVARLALLNTALQNPSKDIGSNEIEKCRGFSYHLMGLAKEQKVKLAENSKMLVLLRCHASQLFALTEYGIPLPSQHFMQEWMKRLKDLLASLILYLEQLWVLLNACPSKCTTEEMPLLSFSQLPPMLQCLKGDSIWSSTLDKVHTLANSLVKVRSALEKSESTPLFFRKEHKELLVSSLYQLRALEDGYTQIKSLATTVTEIRKTFECEPTEKGIIVVELTLLEQRMFSEAEEFTAALLNQANHDGKYAQESVDEFRVELEILIMKTLSGIEVIYKEFAHDANSSEEESDSVEEKEEDSKLEPNHLVQKLVGSLFDLFPKLNFKFIEKQLCRVTSRLQRLLNNDEQRSVCKRMLTNYLPCLDQLLLLYEFFVTQLAAAYRVSVKLLSILLVIFINLAQKGFCIPSQKTQKDTTEGTSSGGMGLAEGEGEKDVSERIESEDQLEEAKSKDAEKEQQDDEECKEENGIEMSEDFDGKVQDIGNKEEKENESEKENDEDIDKEMGDTAEDADTLDARVWGVDSKEEEDEESDPNQEEAQSGKGEKTGESEIVSKSKQETANEDEPSRQEEEQKKKDINEMDEDGDDDQVNPYHGQMEPQQEPDPLDLPEDMQLDEGEKPEDGGEEDTENPFDIDAMKEHKPPEPGSESKEDKSNAEEEKEENIGDEDEAIGKDDKQEETDNGKEENEDESEITKKDEHKPGEEPKEEENNREMAEPSIDDPTAEPAEKAEDMDRKFGSGDKVKGEDQKEEEIKGEEASGEVGDKEQQGVGQSQMQEESEAGHSGKAAAAALSTDSQPVSKQLEKRPSKGEARDNRTLGDDTGPLKKRLKMLNVAAEEEEEKVEAIESEWYQHVKETKDKSHTQTMDAATKEQAEKQLGQWSKEEDLKENGEEDEDVNMQDEDMEQVFTKTRTGQKKLEVDSLEDHKEKDIKEEDSGEMIETLGAERGNQESAYYTSFEQDILTTPPDLQAIRDQLEQQLATWNQPPADSEAQRVWEEFSALTLSLAQDLSEQLRLVLEPTRAAHLKGDYRTGKRINMRKVIPYIASEFRKDKIWLRRTKPSKREYQIVIAIDDSASMADSHSKELAFESLALVTKALTLVEAGELAVVSFGESPQVLHPLGETFTEQNGAKLLQQLTFSQKSTKMGQLVRFATTMLGNQRSHSGDRPAQLLIIVSDGRGVQSEGSDVLQQAIRYAKHAGVLMVFIIIDSPESKDSVLELQSVDMIDGTPAMCSYLDNFPFPYYMILKDISALPAVLSDALRQWFELIANTDSY